MIRTITSDEYIEIKAEVFKIIRANAESKSALKVMKEIKKQFPAVKPEVISQCIQELYESQK